MKFRATPRRIIVGFENFFLIEVKRIIVMLNNAPTKAKNGTETVFPRIIPIAIPKEAPPETPRV